MALTIPLENQRYAKLRVLTRSSFGAGTGSADDQRVSGGGWTPQPMLRRGRAMSKGFEVQFFERVAFPQVGRARVRYSYGLYDTGRVGGTEEDPTGGIPDLTGHEIRIQVAEAPELDADEVTGWRTVFWGTIDTVEDRMSPGALIPRGERTYHAVDGFYRTSRWALDHHGEYVSHGGGVSLYGHVRGHPGYNFFRNRDSLTAKNRSSSQYQTPAGLQVNYHTAAGAGDSKWTDAQALEHAMQSAKPPGEPSFTLVGSTDLLAGESSWEIREGENVNSFAMRVLKRERGKGLAFVDWADDSGDPTGPLTVYVTINAQIAADILYTDPATGLDVTILGAESRSTPEAPTVVTVDLTGDHRNVEESFQLGDPDQFRVGYLETLGEKIEALATASYIDGRSGSAPNFDGITLVRGWSPEHQTTFRALTGSNLVKRQEMQHYPVYQLHQFNPRWDGRAGDGNAGATVSLHRIDYRCSADGRILTPETATALEQADYENVARTAPLEVELLEDLPLFSGYSYAAATPTSISSGSTLLNARRRMDGYVRISANRYLTFDQTATGSIHVTMDGTDVYIVHSGDDGAGTRFFSDTTLTGASAVYNYEALVLTVGLRLPHRVRLASGDPAAKRRANIHLSNVHLWLASPGAIHDLDTATGSSTLGYAGRRNACLGTATSPGILRDDRSALARAHHLAWAWFGSDSTHQSATWALRACGLLPSFSAYSGSNVTTGTPADVAYPQLGQVVTTITANGQDLALNTPVTRVAYDAEAGVTTFSTEWNELSFE